jgi:hypothetical protein
MPESFDDLFESYSNIVSEAKGRLGIIDRALARPLPDDGLMEYVAVSDLCALQFRKTFEAIALGCLLVHGDLPGTKRLRDDTYRADKLLKALEKLHQDFYPKPCTLTRYDNGGMEIGEVTEEWLTKNALKKYYFEFDHEMHVGTLSRRKISAAAISHDSLAMILRQTKQLILTHWIFLSDGRRILCETERTPNKINVMLLTPQ